MKRWSLWLSLALGLLTIVALSWTHRSVGYARDEAIYFEASRHYSAWVEQVAASPGKLVDRKLRDRHFAINREHPALLKTLAGLSARLLSDSSGTPSAPASRGRGARPGVFPLMPEGAAMRLVAQAFAGLGVGLLFFVGARFAGPTGGLIAAGSFILLPRVWFHAGLHAFDVPIAVLTLVVALAYRAGLHSRRWALACGPLLGLAIAVKHNALFIGPMLALHFLSCVAVARFRDRQILDRAFFTRGPGAAPMLAMVSMVLVAPLVAWLTWPWLWSDPGPRLIEYIEFHARHSWYNYEFLGVNYNQPPMPITAPFVMTWATVPTVLLVLGIGGIIWASIADLRRPDGDRGPDGGSLAASDGLLGAIFVLVPIALIAWPTTPIFGGTKHWITAYPFLALGGAFAWQRLWQHAQLRVHRTARPIAAAMCLGPALWATVDGHPYNLSQYAPAIGGPRGAAALGLNRGFWGYNGLPLLQELEPRSAVYIHDMHPLAVTQLKRENRWPNQLRSTSLSRAAAGLLFHERHMITYEVELWSQTERTAPSAVLTLDDIPLTSLYER